MCGEYNMYTVGDRTATARHIIIKIIRGLCEYSKTDCRDFLMRQNNARRRFRRIITVYVGLWMDGRE